MSATDHIKHYSATDIQRYLEGKMLPAEMHDLEKAALEDPFLADAIEGMQQTLEQHDAPLIHAHLQDIRQQVAERTRKQSSRMAPVRAFRWWQAAAAAVVVITGGIWAFNYFQQTEEKVAQNQVAFVKPVTRQDSVIPPTPTTAPEAAATDSIMASYKYTTTEKNNIQSNPASSLEQPLPPLTAAKDQAASEPVALHDDLQARQYKTSTLTLQDGIQITPDASGVDSLSKKIPGMKVTQDGVVRQTDNNRKAYYNSLDKTFKSKPGDYEQIVIAKQVRDTTAQGFFSKPQELTMNRSRKELSDKAAKKNPNALLSGFVSGRVTDQANNPLSNALLRVEDNRVFYTDRQGQFKIPVNDSVVNIAVGSNGYYTQNLQLSNNTRNYNIALNQLGVKAPNPQLNEAIRIRGVSTVNKADSIARRINYPEVLVQDAQPEDGWLDFQQYLEKNKQVPPGTPQLTGVVVVSFMVHKKGLLSDFKIEQSLDKAYDEEALRLVKAGPAWKLNKGRKTKVTVLVRF